jgi:hypothetical protein
LIGVFVKHHQHIHPFYMHPIGLTDSYRTKQHLIWENHNTFFLHRTHHDLLPAN